MKETDFFPSFWTHRSSVFHCLPWKRLWMYGWDDTRGMSVSAGMRTTVRSAKRKPPATVLLFFSSFHPSGAIVVAAGLMKSHKMENTWASDYSWWTPPWNICDLEINHIVLSHWYGGESLFAAAIINLTKRFIPPFPYPFPLLCHLRVWVQEHLDLKNSEQPRPCHQHFQVLTLMSDTCHIGIAWKEITS